MKAVAIFFSILLSCKVQAMEHRPDEVDDWSISGQIELQKGELSPKAEDLVWQMVATRKPKPRVLPIEHIPRFDSATKLQVDQNGKFTLKSNEYSVYLFTEPTVLEMYWKNTGRFLFSDVFKVEASPFQLKDVKLKFSEQTDNAVRYRIVDLETGKPAAKLPVLFYVSDDSFSAPCVSRFEIAESVTDDHGIVSVDHLPKGKIGTYPKPSRTGSGGGTAYPDREWLELKPVYPSMGKAELKEIPDDKVPLVYYVPEGKAIYWNSILLEDPVRLVKAGTVLEFSAIREDTYTVKDWDPNLKFRVTVGEKGLIKTRVVPEGWYHVKSIEGEHVDTEVGIHGVGSILYGNLKDWKPPGE
jgi:hypothetical protein